MAPGSTLVYRVEIEFVSGSGTYVDLSSRVTDLTITRPAGTRLGEATPTTLEANFLNHPATTAEIAAWGLTVGVGFCPLSPESQAAAFSPNVTRDRLVKVTAVWAGGASTAIRFWGWVDTWVPDAGALPPTTAMVTLSATCVLGRYARRQLLSYYGEYNMQSPDYDYWPLNEEPGSTTFKGYAQAGQPVNDAKLVLPYVIPGKAELQAAEGGHSTDGQIQFTRADFLNFPGPVIQVPTRKNGNVPSSFEAWIRLDVDPDGSDDDVLVAYTASGNITWRWTAAKSGSKIVWRMYDGLNVVKLFYDTGAPRDGNWHFFFLWFPTATDSAVAISNRGNKYATSIGSGATWFYDPRNFDYVMVGGNMSPTRPGKMSNTAQAAVSSFRIGYNGNLASGQGANDPGTPVIASSYKNRLVTSGLNVDTLIGGGVSTVTDPRPIQPNNNTKELLERWNQLARSTLSELITRTDGRRQWSALADTRPTVVSLTLDAEQDLSAPDGGWQPVKDESPTRATAVSPVGTYTYTRSDVETSTGTRLDAPSLDTVNGDITGAMQVAAFSTVQTGTRLRSFGFDPTTTSTDKLTATMALQPRQRVRITTLPAALTGQTHIDVFAYGWTEKFNAEDGSCGWTFETWLADDVVEGAFDDNEYGRFARGDGYTASTGTAIGTTTPGTLVLAGTAPLTLDPAAYPLDLDWAGERVTIPAAPASAGLLQTVTIGTRGVAPTVARVHAAGDLVDIWHAARFGV